MFRGVFNRSGRLYYRYRANHDADGACPGGLCDQTPGSGTTDTAQIR